MSQWGMIPILLLLIPLVSAGGLSIYERAARLIDDRYLRVDEFSVEDAFGEAAESAERAYPWLIVEHEGTTVRLRRGDQPEWSTVELTGTDGAPTIRELPDALERLENAILAVDASLPEGADLPVTLMRGVCRALDRHSVILHKARLERFDQRIKGKLTGIGAKVGVENGEVVIRSVFDDGPASTGGLLGGDVVLRIDGVSTTGMALDQAVSRMRGPARTQVELRVRRRSDEGLDEVVELALTRAEVKIPNVSWRIGDDGVGIITIDHFSENTARLTAAALTDFELGTPTGLPLRGIVLDLRSNSGGSMIQSSETADLFLNDGVIFRTTGRDGIPVPNLLREVRAHPADVAPFEPPVPMIVLQNKGSASASEILSGALASLGRAVILGGRSHGKGTVQKVYFLRGGRDKVRLKLTVAEYRLAADVAVHGEGIAPDLDVRRVRFHRYGVWVPPSADEGTMSVLDTDERPGWREGGAPETDGDPLMDLATRLVVEIPDADRQNALDVLEQMGPSLMDESYVRVMETFRFRDLDWTRSDEPQSVLDVGAVVTLVGDPQAGERAELRAEVSNLGPAPLHQLRLRLSSDSRHRPWNGLTIPIGFLPPDEKGIGSTLVSLPIGGPDRDDLVSITVEADGLDPVELEPVLLHVDGREPPPMSVEARMVPHEEHHRVELTLFNHGEETLTGVRARFSWDEDSGVELLDREALLPTLPGEEQARLDLSVRLLSPEATEPEVVGVQLQLHVEVEQFQQVLKVPLTIPVDGRPVVVSPPVISMDPPTIMATGEAKVGVAIADDTAVGEVEVWWGSDQVAYHPGGTDQVTMDVHLDVQEALERLTVIASDEDGIRVRKVRYIRGEAPAASVDPAAMSTPTDSE